MYSYGVDVFHITYRDSRIVGVAHNLVFDFLVALDTLLDEYLMHGGQTQSVFDNLQKLLFVVGKAAARTAESKSGTEHYGIAYLFYRL